MKGRLILLADDDPYVQKTVRRVAEEYEYQIISATTGSEVKATALDLSPDLVVLDLTFPDADGRDVLAQLKSDLRTADIPVLIWSARNPESERRIALDLGAEDYVEKSDVETLLKKVKRLLLRLDSE